MRCNTPVATGEREQSEEIQTQQAEIVEMLRAFAAIVTVQRCRHHSSMQRSYSCLMMHCHEHVCGNESGGEGEGC